jgi:1,4-dihydroxy-6-naphthoate synthase
MTRRDPISLAYSPCPNDTFIFAAWTNGLLPDAPPVDVVLDDVEALNRAAREARFELTKVSYGAIPYLVGDYRVLRAGGALGRGCGPLVVARPGAAGAAGGLDALPRDARIAIPGRMTTAFLLLRLALSFEPDVVVMRFDRIVEAVAKGQVDAGLIIHESRFTYAAAGLVRVADLGEWWEQETGRPIPLGGILARRDLDDGEAARIDEAIGASLSFARTREPEVASYVRAHAFEMDEAVMRAHIDLYVNGYTDDVGADGIAAVDELFARASRAGLIPEGTRPAFVPR